MASVLKLGAKPLRLEDVDDVARRGRKVELSSGSARKVNEAYRFLASAIDSGEALYGVNTGFGLMSDVRIRKDQVRELQYNFLRSHAVGMGNPLPEIHVRAMLLLRANALAQGHSGVRVELIQQILKLLNKGIHPVVPQQGSVGASGDLAPLAHLALPLIGEGEVFYKGKRMPSHRVLKQAGLKPVDLGPKAGLALTNGTQFMAAIGTLTLLEAEDLCDLSDVVGAMTLEAVRGTPQAFYEPLHKLRPHPGQVRSAKRLRSFLSDGGQSSQVTKSHDNCGKVQDSYSLRCMPQVHGASYDLIRGVRHILETEINSVTDNPIIFPKQKKVVSGGNFHGQYLAFAMDTLAMACAELANISERRLDKLTDPVFSGLPAFLTREGGLNSGFMIVQYAAASIVSENKTLAHPASVDSIPTSANKEDHVSMGAWGARKAMQVVCNVRRVLAMELLGACQGLDFLRPLKTTRTLERVRKRVRSISPSVTHDREFHRDIAAVEELLKAHSAKNLCS